MFSIFVAALLPVLKPVALAAATAAAAGATSAFVRLTQRLHVETTATQRDSLHKALETALQTAIITMMSDGTSMKDINLGTAVNMARDIVRKTNPQTILKTGATNMLDDLLTSKLPSVLHNMGLTSKDATATTNAVIAVATPTVESAIDKTLGNFLK